MSAALHRPLLVLLSMVTTLGLTACSGYDPSDDDSDVRGTWTLTDEAGTSYVSITDATLAFFFSEDGECFVAAEFDIADVEGDVYTVGFDGSGDTFEIRRSGDDLLIDDERWEASNVNVTSLEACPGPVNLPACSTLPVVTVGGSVDGSLESTDPAKPDMSRYDLYRLDLSASTDVGIDMASDIVDSYLGLFTKAGAYLARNDDRDATTLDARIDRVLPAGCHIIMATSYAGNEFGAYTLGVSAN